MSTPLHRGKRTVELKIMVPEAMGDHIKLMARNVGCKPADVHLNALFFSVTGKTFDDHVADDRRQALSPEVRRLGDKREDE